MLRKPFPMKPGGVEVGTIPNGPRGIREKGNGVIARGEGGRKSLTPFQDVERAHISRSLRNSYPSE